ncbi:uncharacterized protein LOC128995962 [Macrosteles quadrilineatus]|uniref:uncharacterized protein LOC128995927 n=1 Tax=Macrosteles quadrilineatus TaxID=74068 RepID=UPI0023E15C81|nr:uncharacterized protein LOC128995927 [Macrosteles quadrilineatus]XP_054277021.1 uncharacterized protein LOC128995962 [Macrosteles quadrilineatus]
MRSLALVCSILVFSANAAPFIGKLSNVGNAVRNIGASLFNKLSGGQVPPLPPAVAEGDLLRQLEFMNKMLKQVRGFVMSPSPLIREKMRPYLQTLVDQVIPQFEQLQFTNEELQHIYKLRPEDIVKFRALLVDTIDELKMMRSSMNKEPKPNC